MARSVLVITANGEFGRFIQHSLEGAGSYKVMVVDSDQEALLCIQTVAFTIAILDCEIPGEHTVALAASMRQKLPKMRLVLVCSADNPVYPEAAGIQPAGLISKPVSLPELLDTMSKVVQSASEPTKTLAARAKPAEPGAPAAPPAPEWLLDANWAARHLTRLSLESSAEAALIMRDGVVWAYAGELSQPAVDELVEKLTTYWDVDTTPTRISLGHKQAVDMVRFVRLDATQDEYMLYATSLGQGMLLSLAFETDTPFSTIRAQASYLARALATPPDAPLPAYPRPAALVNQRRSQNGATGYLNTNLPPLLEDVPPPSPDQLKKSILGRQVIPSWFEEASVPASLIEAPLPQPKPIEQPPLVKAARENRGIIEQPSPQKAVEIKPASTPGNPIPEPAAINHSANPDGRPAQTPQVNGKSLMAPDLLPSTPTLHYLTYCCTLIPRMPQHKLSGDLAQHLQDWMPQLFLAFGWQLLHLGIAPDYLLVIGRVSPNTSPGSFVRILRQQSSRRICAAFPKIDNENPSHDFWAPGYLILSNSQPPPNHVIRHYIEQARMQQGAPKDGQTKS